MAALRRRRPCPSWHFAPPHCCARATRPCLLPLSQRKADPAVHSFGPENSTANKRLVFLCSKGSRVSGSHSAGHWTLPPCRVTVCLRDKARFREDVKARVDKVGGRGSADRDALSSSVSPAPTVISDEVGLFSRLAPGSVPVGSKGQNLADDAALPGGLQVFL